MDDFRYANNNPENRPYHEQLIDNFDRLHDEAFAIASTILNNPDDITVNNAQVEYEEKIGELVVAFENITENMLLAGDIKGWATYVRSTEIIRYNNMKKLGYDGEPTVTDEDDLHRQAQAFIDKIGERAIHELEDRPSITSIEQMFVDENNDPYGELAKYRHSGNMIEDFYKLVDGERPLRETNVIVLDDVRVNRAVDMHRDQISKTFQQIITEERKEPIGPVTDSITGLEKSRSALLDHLSDIYDGIGGTSKQEAIRKLLELTDELTSALRTMLETVSDSVPPREAIAIISDTLRAHDKKLASNMGVIAQMERKDWMKWSSEDMIRDYAISYADPQGLTIPVGSKDTPVFMTRDEVIESLTQKLNDKLFQIIELSPKNYVEKMAEKKRNKRNLLVGGTVIAASFFWDQFKRRHRR